MGSLSTSGALLALVVGFTLTLAHYSFLASLLFFFISSSKATKYRQDVKKNFEEDFKEGRQRDWLQVLCNGFMATQLALLYLLDIGSADLPVDFRHQYRASWLGMAVLGAVSCCNGDTWASELGSVVSKGDPFLITTLQFSGQDPKTGKIVEVCRSDVVAIAGKQILDNHSVNLVSSIVTALVLPKVALAMGM